jgi:hypothetical protein
MMGSLCAESPRRGMSKTTGNLWKRFKMDSEQRRSKGIIASHKLLVKGTGVSTQQNQQNQQSYLVEEQTEQTGQTCQISQNQRNINNPFAWKLPLKQLTCASNAHCYRCKASQFNEICRLLHSSLLDYRCTLAANRGSQTQMLPNLDGWAQAMS